MAIDREEDTVYLCDTTSSDGLVLKNDKWRGLNGVSAGPADTVFVFDRVSDSTDSLLLLFLQGIVLESHNVGMWNIGAVRFSKYDTL